MDWMTFVVELVKALAWPAVAVTIIVVFKDKLTKLFEDMTELKGLGIEAKFARGAKAALAEVEAIEAIQPPAPADIPPEDGPFDPNAPFDDPFLAKVQPIDNQLVVSNPKAAVLLARSNIEAAIKRLMTREGTLVKSPGGTNLMSVLRQLHADRVITPNVYKMAVELIQLGNKAAHEEEFEPSVSAADDFVGATEKLVKLLMRSRTPQNSND